ncbi:putative translation initiation factor, aIF-2BI family [Methanococcus vannielii SB]|uniref:Putative methylthioribose-1-phosphate isomerase n=1 Tax=Methanococcus vannielii (strain ATCC 35089 / DSM 1224 / JCM 13029 / OCM 148 / SB) TaxID=406327 RepID=A6UQQ9_METVS|nr:S-methyl-5-thioribose-1-phosphate isomerase [Methanococcus vannielii]ABR54831.1 putative translation initiation factor, aIF-2BI family [Methanococcus vannielii SB]
MDRDLRPIFWNDEEKKLILVDQRKLPNKLEYFECKTYTDVCYAIKDMVVRGAPAIGVSAAYGLALAELNGNNIENAYMELKETRPTAVNLFWALDKAMNAKINGKSILDEAKLIHDEDVELCKKIGKIGETLIKDGDTILTHCNAGALATSAYGTALSIIRFAHYSGKKINVISDETRPRLQGAKLTCFELNYEKIPVKAICDNTAGYLMSKGMIDKIIVGADRILSDYHVFNKIGTYSLAILAKYHNVPFYVAAPYSTFDFKSKLVDIVVEERDDVEVTYIDGVRVVSEGVSAYNFAFDCTPPELITGIITEKEIIYPNLGK